MMDNGWIELHRELLNKPIWLLSTPEQSKILITLLLMANHEVKSWEFKGRQFTCKPGQFITSIDSIVKNSGYGISIQNVRTSLKRFEKCEFLTDEPTKQNRLITICNWERYQPKKIKPNKAANSQLTDSQQTANNQLTTNNNDNNVNNDNKEINIVDFDFLKFWNLYNKKVGDKAKILKKWSNLKQIERDAIFKTLPAFLSAITDKQFQPFPGTYLNNKRWQDEISQTDISTRSDGFKPQPIYR